MLLPKIQPGIIPLSLFAVKNLEKDYIYYNYNNTQGEKKKKLMLKKDKFSKRKMCRTIMLLLLLLFWGGMGGGKLGRISPLTCNLFYPVVQKLQELRQSSHCS